LEALHVARQIQPDVILLDLMLPDMSGAWVLDILRSQPSTRDIPIIVVSAVDEVFLRRQTKGKVAYYFQKPVDMDALSE
jgi:CheY-like chemotaxis protein